jgi:hypothetical protein
LAVYTPTGGKGELLEGFVLAKAGKRSKTWLCPKAARSKRRHAVAACCVLDASDAAFPRQLACPGILRALPSLRAASCFACVN